MTEASPVSAKIAAFVARTADRITELSSQLGQTVRVDRAGVLDRSAFADLQPPGLISANGSCRLLRAADGWVVANLPRESDLDLAPAWIQREIDGDPWAAIAGHLAALPWREGVEGARLLGLPVAGVGEVSADAPTTLHRRAAAGAPVRGRPIKVIDLSTMWAGPLCGQLLAEAGFEVVKYESTSRPDGQREGSPDFFARLNGRKAQATFDSASPADLAHLGDAMAAADLVLTSARPRAFAQMGLSPEALFARNPRLTWVAVSGYGWTGDAADRVAFGDDAAAAGGLVRWTAHGEPHFAGDALADPLTGLAAAAGAFEALSLGGGFLVDAPMAGVASCVAAQAGLG